MPYTIYITRHGQSEYNVKNIIGGDSNLTTDGKLYAEKLGKYIKNENINFLNVWTSNLTRTKETLNYIKKNYKNINHTIYNELNEINAGICNNMSYEQIKNIYPDIYRNRKKDKLNYRYPNGESYIDLQLRLKPIFNKIKNIKENTLIIAHNAVIRMIIGNLQNIDISKQPYIDIPLHTLIKINNNNIEFLNFN
jgi:broad specificity phosphatase PhoE